MVIQNSWLLQPVKHFKGKSYCSSIVNGMGAKQDEPGAPGLFPSSCPPQASPPYPPVPTCPPVAPIRGQHATHFPFMLRPDCCKVPAALWPLKSKYHMPRRTVTRRSHTFYSGGCWPRPSLQACQGAGAGTACPQHPGQPHRPRLSYPSVERASCWGLRTQVKMEFMMSQATGH